MDDFVKRIVKTKSYVSTLYHVESEEELTLKWYNTNKLLETGFTGVKTGITDNAGACMVAILPLD